MNDDTRARVRQVIAEHVQLTAEIAALDDDADLFVAGMTSHASVTLMLALEDSFEVEFPDVMLKRSVFASVNAISDAIEALSTAERAG